MTLVGVDKASVAIFAHVVPETKKVLGSFGLLCRSIGMCAYVGTTVALW